MLAFVGEKALSLVESAEASSTNTIIVNESANQTDNKG